MSSKVKSITVMSIITRKDERVVEWAEDVKTWRAAWKLVDSIMDTDRSQWTKINDGDGYWRLVSKGD